MSKAFCSVSGARRALIDAQVVAQLPIAGAIILGKAHTTEFAYFDGPPPTAIKKQPQPLFVETPEHVQSVPMHGTRQFQRERRRDSRSGRFAPRARLSFGRGVRTPIRSL